MEIKNPNIPLGIPTASPMINEVLLLLDVFEDAAQYPCVSQIPVKQSVAAVHGEPMELIALAPRISQFVPPGLFRKGYKLVLGSARISCTCVFGPSNDTIVLPGEASIHFTGALADEQEFRKSVRLLMSVQHVA